MASAASNEVVFSPSFSFNEDLYQVLHTAVKAYHFRASSFSLDLKLTGGCTHTNTRTQGTSAWDAFPQKKTDCNQHIYTWAMSDAPAGSIKMRGDGRNPSWEHPDGNWQVSGAALGGKHGKKRLGQREWAASLTVKDTLYLQPCPGTKMKWG